MVAVYRSTHNPIWSTWSVGLWVGSHRALSLHSLNIHDPCLSVVSVLTLRFKPCVYIYIYMYTCCAVLRGSLPC